MEAFAEDCLDGDDLCGKKWEEDAREVCFVVWCGRCGGSSRGGNDDDDVVDDDADMSVGLG